MSTSVRELVRERQKEIRDTDLQPDRAAELLVQLSALLGNISDEIREADLDYARVLWASYQAEAKANRAVILAETSPEYQRKREARDLQFLTIELVRGLKYFLRVKAEERREARQ